ncbi:MAG TPA: hypothetical protein VNT75_27230 [Symbiobacteriaceae bacterium]|nr:hypothetical protein [Symbiobacteriaceae bacterium]
MALVHPAQLTLQALRPTVPGHAVILTLLSEIGDPVAWEHGSAHILHVISAMGLATRMLDGEPVPLRALLDQLRRMDLEGQRMKAALQEGPGAGTPEAERLLQIGARTTAAEELLLRCLGLKQ